MILAGQLLLGDRPSANRCRLVPGAVRIDGDQIVEVMEGETTAAADLGGPGCLICPAFTDTHLHLPQADIVGAHGRPLLDWLTQVTFPAEQRWADPAFARAMTQRVCAQLLAHGTVGIAAFSTVHHDATMAALAAAEAAGLRGVVGQSAIERHAPDELTRPAEQLLDETADLLDRYPPGGRIASAVTPRFAVSCSAELLADLGRLAEQRQAVIQTHLAETRRECDWVSQLFDGARYTEVYDAAGLLTPRSLLGHGIYLDPPQRSILRDSGATIAHCPTANSFLRSGTMNRRQLQLDRVNLSLGSDLGAGYERSMVRVARAMLEAAASFSQVPAAELPTAAEAWWQITAGNADALGQTSAGRLETGAPADLLVIEPDIDWLAGPVAPLDRLTWAWDDRWLKRTIARGETAYARP